MHAKQVWDLRKVEVSMTLKGHSDTVTGLRVSPDGTHLLSNAMVSLFSAPHLTDTILFLRPASCNFFTSAALGSTPVHLKIYFMFPYTCIVNWHPIHAAGSKEDVLGTDCHGANTYIPLFEDFSCSSVKAGICID